MIFVLDNYDSFTFNLVNYLRELGAGVEVARAGETSAAQALATGADAFLISPGPGHPDEATTATDLLAACIAASKPVLGVCLGHQVIASHFGGVIVQADRVLHGKMSDISHDGSGLFRGLPSPFSATRYHSLVVDPGSVSPELQVTASADDGTIQALSHRTLPIFGVQFHPESFTTEHGHDLLRNFLRLAQA